MFSIATKGKILVDSLTFLPPLGGVRGAPFKLLNL